MTAVNNSPGSQIGGEVGGKIMVVAFDAFYEVMIMWLYYNCTKGATIYRNKTGTEV